jgi:hypothetical protein
MKEKQKRDEMEMTDKRMEENKWKIHKWEQISKECIDRKGEECEGRRNKEK